MDRFWTPWIAFFGISAIIFAASRTRRSAGFLKFIQWILPFETWKHRSAIFDYKVSLINRILVLAVVGTPITAASIFGADFRRVFAEYFRPVVGGNVAAGLSKVFTHDFLIPTGFWTNLIWSFSLIIIYDLTRTLVHYAFHKVPALWEFHKLHHDANVLTPFTSERFTFVEQFITSLVNSAFGAMYFGLFLFLFGPGKFNILTVFGGVNVFYIHSFITGKFDHSWVWLNFGKLGLIISNPASHLVHHSAEERHRDKNFGNVFSVWDAMLGTYWVPRTEEHFKIGVRDGEYKRNSLSYLYFGVFVDFWNRLMKKEQASLASNESSDGLTCWCGPNCRQVNYAQDNPYPMKNAAWTKLSDLWAPQPRGGESIVDPDASVEIKKSAA